MINWNRIGWEFLSMMRWEYHLFHCFTRHHSDRLRRLESIVKSLEKWKERLPSWLTSLQSRNREITREISWSRSSETERDGECAMCETTWKVSVARKNQLTNSFLVFTHKKDELKIVNSCELFCVWRSYQVVKTFSRWSFFFIWTRNLLGRPQMTSIGMRTKCIMQRPPAMFIDDSDLIVNSWVSQ